MTTNIYLGKTRLLHIAIVAAVTLIGSGCLRERGTGKSVLLYGDIPLGGSYQSVAGRLGPIMWMETNDCGVLRYEQLLVTDAMFITRMNIFFTNGVVLIVSNDIITSKAPMILERSAGSGPGHEK